MSPGLVALPEGRFSVARGRESASRRGSGGGGRRTGKRTADQQIDRDPELRDRPSGADDACGSSHVRSHSCHTNAARHQLSCEERSREGGGPFMPAPGLSEIPPESTSQPSHQLASQGF